MSILLIAVLFGSSPLARGTLIRRRPPFPALRLIPARAGNTGTRLAGASRSPAHPRSRGEHMTSNPSGIGRGGSSPLARGTPLFAQPPLRRPRLIPARAGNTGTDSRAACRAAAHPRSHGEHSSGLSSSGCSGGSSPLARGTRILLVTLLRYRRLIPARAGNTRPGVTREPSCPAHPRSRGEHLHQRSLNAWATGSSPLARGTPP